MTSSSSSNETTPFSISLILFVCVCDPPSTISLHVWCSSVKKRKEREREEEEELLSLDISLKKDFNHLFAVFFNSCHRKPTKSADYFCRKNRFLNWKREEEVWRRIPPHLPRNPKVIKVRTQKGSSLYLFNLPHNQKEEKNSLKNFFHSSFNRRRSISSERTFRVRCKVPFFLKKQIFVAVRKKSKLNYRSFLRKVLIVDILIVFLTHLNLFWAKTPHTHWAKMRFYHIRQVAALVLLLSPWQLNSIEGFFEGLHDS